MRSGYFVIKNFIYMIFSNVITRVMSLLTVVYLANKLGPEGFGKLNWALVFVSYFAVLGDFGLSISGAKELSGEKNNLKAIFSKISGAKIIFGILAFVFCFLAILLAKPQEDYLYLVLVSGLTIFSSVTFFQAWVFQGLENMKHLGYSLILQAFVYVFLIFSFVKERTPLYEVALILFISQLSAVFYQLYFLKRERPEFSFSVNFSQTLAMAKETYHITWSHFTLIIGQNSPLFIIGLFSCPSAAGFFAASQKISSLIWEVISNFSNVIFPAMSRNFEKDRKKINKMANYALKLVFTALTPLLVLIAVLSYSITEFIYGNSFIESYWTLKIMVFLPLLMFLDSMATNILIISARQRETSFIKSIVFFIAFVLSALSVKKFGINCVALIFLASFLFSALWQYEKVSDFIKIEWKDCVLTPLFFSAVSGVAVYYIKSYNLFLAFLSAAIFYFLMIYYFGPFKEEEKKYLLDNIKTLKARFFNLEF